MNINGIKTILYKCTFFMVFVFCLISCNKSNFHKINETSIGSGKSVKTYETSTKSNSDNYEIIHREGLINTDCDYNNEYLGYGGKLKKGDRIIVFLGRNNYIRESYGDENETEQIDVRVEVKTEDDGVSMWVREQNITYNDECYNSWFKNVLFVREYYYISTPEHIFETEYAIYNWGDNVDRKSAMLSYLPSGFGGTTEEGKLRISENFLILGPGYGDVFRVKKIIKRDENIYKLCLTETSGSELEVTLVDDGNGIIMTECIVKENGTDVFKKYTYIQDLLNIKYVPYNKDKSEKSRKAVIAWIDEQIKKLEK